VAGPLELIDTWPVPTAAAATIDRQGNISAHGAVDHVFRLASVSKLIAAWATLVAVEEGSIELDEPAGPPDATVRQLLAHAAGYPFEGPAPISAPGRTRIYSNTGIEALADHVATRTGIPFGTYVSEAIGAPLGMTSLVAAGSPAKSFRCSVNDLIRFAGEMLTPTLLSAETVAAATSVQFPELSGVLPGIGRFTPNPWGLGPEIRGAKHPHWTGRTNSPETFGHFGGSGTFLWVDPTAGIACLALTDRNFDTWSMQHWPQLSDAVLTHHRSSG
jgi:CubicO group peptidase (beta-lactamase class C family)